ncbi:NupC/NupG family nucleoside CNT transporter, partial [Klebsiella pneumoniae]|nr:NupC/NupG family nucleoside CNT transporter [Klebsiella pneumoniae]
MKFLIGILGLIVVLALAWVASSGKNRVKYRPVIVMIVLQFVLGYILLNTGVGNYLVGGFAQGFGYLLTYAGEGVNFVFGGLV